MSRLPIIRSETLGWVLAQNSSELIRTLVRELHGEVRWTLVLDANEVLRALPLLVAGTARPMFVEVRDAGGMDLVATQRVAQEVERGLPDFVKDGVALADLRTAWDLLRPALRLQEPQDESMADPRLEGLRERDHTDLPTAALALELGAPVFTSDRDFEAVDGLRRVGMRDIKLLRSVVRGEAHIVVPVVFLLGGGFEAARSLWEWFAQQPRPKQLLLLGGLATLTWLARDQLKVILQGFLRESCGAVLLWSKDGSEQALPAASVLAAQGVPLPNVIGTLLQTHPASATGGSDA